MSVQSSRTEINLIDQSTCCSTYPKSLKELCSTKIYNFLSTNSFGFRNNRSAVKQLLLFVKISRELFHDSQENDELHVLYLNFRNAFDSFPHQKLVDKLKHGLGGKLLNMIGSYLSHSDFKV